MEKKHAIHLLKQLIVKKGQHRHNKALTIICQELNDLSGRIIYAVETGKEPKEYMKTKFYNFYSDPSHGWLKVSRSEVDKLGIAEKISTFSYKNGDNIYLEEDYDALLFIKAQEAKGIEVKFKESSTNRSSKIRNYPHFTTL
jgi:hypothetical protein